MAFGRYGTGEGGAWRKGLVSVSATPARGRNVESNVLPILSKSSRVMCELSGLEAAHYKNRM